MLHGVDVSAQTGEQFRATQNAQSRRSERRQTAKQPSAQSSKQA
jgi:hypothetical protein